MIKLTDAAANKLKTILESKNGKYKGIRAAVRGGGCSGFSYFLDFVELIPPKDKLIDSKGIAIVVDAKSFLYLMGTEIDYQDDLSGAGFKFNNPNAKRTCGCGESFSV